MKHILVTGGAGFIGFHVAKHLLSHGEAVVIVDNFNRFYAAKLKHDRIRELKTYSKLRVHKADISQPVSLQAIFKQYRFNKICHLASQTNVRHSQQNPFVYEKWNSLGMLNMLECARQYGVPYFIYASSSSVYGNNSPVCSSEHNQTDRPLSIYAATKKSMELYAQVYHHLYGLHCTGLRLFNVYGPWMRPDMAMHVFTRSILEGKPITLFDPNHVMRDFTYVDDAVQGIIAAIDKGLPNEIVNLGNHKPVRLLRLVELLEKALGKKAKIIRRHLPSCEVVKTCASIAKAHKLLNYCPKTNLESGIPQFVAWYRAYYGLPSARVSAHNDSNSA